MHWVFSCQGWEDQLPAFKKSVPTNLAIRSIEQTAGFEAKKTGVAKGGWIYSGLMAWSSRATKLGKKGAKFLSEASLRNTEAGELCEAPNGPGRG